MSKFVNLNLSESHLFKTFYPIYTMSKNNNLLFKIAFIFISLLILFLGLYLLLKYKLVGLFLGLYFTFLLGYNLRKFYITRFKEDIFTQYLYLFLIIPMVVFAFIVNKNNKIDKKGMTVSEKTFIKNKINAMLDSCNYYEAKLYENTLLFKPKEDNSEYLASDSIKTYSRFESLKHNPKYDYLVRSFIKCPRDSNQLVYIFDNEGTLSVILKLKNTDNNNLDNLKFYFEELDKD